MSAIGDPVMVGRFLVDASDNSLAIDSAEGTVAIEYTETEVIVRGFSLGVSDAPSFELSIPLEHFMPPIDRGRG